MKNLIKRGLKQRKGGRLRGSFTITIYVEYVIISDWTTVKTLLSSFYIKRRLSQ